MSVARENEGDARLLESFGVVRRVTQKHRHVVAVRVTERAAEVLSIVHQVAHAGDAEAGSPAVEPSPTVVELWDPRAGECSPRRRWSVPVIVVPVQYTCQFLR
ncbi:MAG: hypothetical protein JW751_28165 [Polyangiaceae bacterium]|nr:hypothetical protein [Polyangiaceae bacterium]